MRNNSFASCRRLAKLISTGTGVNPEGYCLNGGSNPLRSHNETTRVQESCQRDDIVWRKYLGWRSVGSVIVSRRRWGRGWKSLTVVSCFIIMFGWPSGLRQHTVNVPCEEHRRFESCPKRKSSFVFSLLF